MANHLDLEEQEQIDQLKHFWNTWGTLISSVVFVVAGGFAAWNGYQFWQTRQATQAAALLEAVEGAVASSDQARLVQAFADIRSSYAGTQQASQAGLITAKALLDAGKPDAAKEALSWVAEQSKSPALRTLATLRLAGILMDQKDLEGAGKLLAKDMPSEFSAVVADRKGDLLALQGKPAEAVIEYRRSYQLLGDSAEYRRIVEVKLNSLGEAIAASPVVQTNAAAQ